jgi:hypothetical protein
MPQPDNSNLPGPALEIPYLTHIQGCFQAKPVDNPGYVAATLC